MQPAHSCRMNHITVKTLRFYEEQGLLMPALIHPETGYRYYTLSQMAVLHQITALKLAGFTLEEIAHIHSGADEETVLLKKKAALLAKIADLTRQIAVVDGYLSKKKIGLSAPVLIKTIPETTVACMRIRLESYDGLFDRMPEMGALMEKAGCECALPEYCFTNYLEMKTPRLIQFNYSSAGQPRGYISVKRVHFAGRVKPGCFCYMEVAA